MLVALVITASEGDSSSPGGAIISQAGPKDRNRGGARRQNAGWPAEVAVTIQAAPPSTRHQLRVRPKRRLALPMRLRRPDQAQGAPPPGRRRHTAAPDDGTARLR